jgi:hypothetical protein
MFTMAFVIGASTMAGATPVWSLTSSPNYGTSSNVLSAVSCVSATSCKAVGYYGINNSLPRTLVESWNGTAWSLQSSPSIGTGTNYLLGVSCVSATSCKAVGYYNNSSNVYRTLVESWNGTAWSIQSSPNNGTGRNALSGVSCVSATSCKAVGGYAPAAGYARTLVESWNGTAWSIQSSPNNATLNSELSGVSCVSATSCKAVGDYGGSTNTSYVQHPFVESWNGTAWSIQSSPYYGTTSYLSGVSCVSATSCKAIGVYVTSSNVHRTLVESWNGTAWSLQSIPNNGTKDNLLSGVSCVSATSCKAVGYYVNSSFGVRTLVESWNGTAWSIQSSPNNGTGQNYLSGVRCVSATSCKAVGYYVNSSSADRTLVESYG